MKFFFDANLSVYLAHAIGILCKAERGEILVEHIFDRFRPNTQDIEWIDTLGDEGGWTIISQDRFARNDFEKEALRKHGFTVFILKRAWADQPGWEKSARLIRWWPRIMEQTGLVTGGAVFGVPFHFSGKGKFETVKL